MRVECPACRTAYEVPDAAISPGRRFRCALCRQDWSPEPGQDTAEHDGQAEPMAAPLYDDAGWAAEAPADPPLPFSDFQPAYRPAEERLAGESGFFAGARAEVVAAWLLSVLLLGAGAAEAVYWRDPIMAAWPPSARLYHVLGLRGPAAQG